MAYFLRFNFYSIIKTNFILDYIVNNHFDQEGLQNLTFFINLMHVAYSLLRVNNVFIAHLINIAR
jgi:hypothetical protein